MTETGRPKYTYHPIWARGVSIILVIALFTITGCRSDNDGITIDPEGLSIEGTYYFHSDHLGSRKYMTDQDGNKIANVDYTPYGEQTTTGDNIFNKKFTGQIEDHKTELIYYNARYYDPQIGRFITPDSIIPDMANSQAFNRYMYVLGNPMIYDDPAGHLPRIPYIGDNTTTAEDDEGNKRKNDTRFNWDWKKFKKKFKKEEEITGVHSSEKRDKLGGENHWATILLDRIILHPTATVHDHFLYKWKSMSEKKQNTIKIAYIIGALLTGNPILIASAILFLFSPSAGSMIPAFFIGTTIGIINLHIWVINKHLDVGENAWEKLKQVGNKTKSVAGSTNKFAKSAVSSTTSTIKKVTNTITNTVNKLKFW